MCVCGGGGGGGGGCKDDCRLKIANYMYLSLTDSEGFCTLITPTCIVILSSTFEKKHL